jgi:uncharacterized protein (TIGR02391 family)
VNRIPCFDASHLEAVCRVLGATDQGLSGPEIGHILADMDVRDTDPELTKWKRLYNALATVQNKHQVGNHVLMFINRAMQPARYASSPALFEIRRDGLNVALAFVGYGVNEKGKVVRTTRASTLSDARARAGRLRAILEARGTHAEVLRYCRAELLEENYFHAVLEAVKSIAERTRIMTGLTCDGADLVSQAFAIKGPLIAVNALRTDTEVSEQKGVANLLIGLFGAVRNPAAHAPKIAWPMPEQDALDILALISYIHRKLDSATTKPPVAPA